MHERGCIRDVAEALQSIQQDRVIQDLKAKDYYRT
jgi:hypothetical protein